MGGLGVLFSAGLSVANKVFYVEEDPRIAAVQEALPGANCGGCGFPGCSAFAEAIVSGSAEINGCPVNTADGVQEVAEIMGVEAIAGERIIARVLCRGGHYETAKKSDYRGIHSCIAASITGGGDRLCEYGCMGFGDCVDVCPFDAMYMDDNGLPVILDDKCTGCGNCVDACPRGVIELHPESNRLFVLCNNHDKPKDARSVCIRACIGCGICARAVEEGQIQIENNLAKIDYSVFGKDAVLPTDKCSTECMVVIDSENNKVPASAA